MSLGYLLDTSVAIHLRDDNPAALEAVAPLRPLPFLSSLTRAELEGGVTVRHALARRRRSGLDLLLRTFDVLAFTSKTAGIYGEIVARGRFSRRKAIDRMIAASAIEHHLKLITVNESDFADIDNLTLEIWKL